MKSLSMTLATMSLLFVLHGCCCGDEFADGLEAGFNEELQKELAKGQSGGSEDGDGDSPAKKESGDAKAATGTPCERVCAFQAECNKGEDKALCVQNCLDQGSYSRKEVACVANATCETYTACFGGE